MENLERQMEHLKTLLEGRNLCLRNLLKISELFLTEIATGNIENLEKFQIQRKKLIRVTQNLDADISTAAGTHPNLDNLDHEEIKAFLRQKNSLLQSVIDLDTEILNYIRQIKEDTLRNLQALHGQRKTLSAYKSPQNQIETAEGNTNLNHKA